MIKKIIEELYICNPIEGQRPVRNFLTKEK